jgi:hypothetical protein
MKRRGMRIEIESGVKVVIKVSAVDLVPSRIPCMTVVPVTVLRLGKAGSELRLSIRPFLG